MKNIKVTVEYETPKTDKFAELMKQYEEIKQTSTETVNYYKPLADAAEEKKLELILEQLKTIEGYLEQIYSINPQKINIVAYGITDGHYDEKLVVKYEKSTFTVRWCEWYELSLGMYRQAKVRFNGEQYEGWNILGKWDEWKMYKQLEESCFNLLKREIDKQKKKAETEVNRLKNITEN